MRRTPRVFGSMLPIGVGFALAWTGCAQVLDIEGWQPGAGGGGGEGQQSSSAASMMTTSNGSGMQATAVSSSVGSGGQGGQVNSCPGTCVSAVPMGWEGYVTVLMTNENAPLPPCNGDWPVQMDWKTGVLIAPDAICGSCSCSAPTGGQCSLTGAGISVHSTQGCTDSLGTTPVTNSACTFIGTGMLSSFRLKLVGQSLPSNSSCTPSGTAPTIPPAWFDKHARMCGDPGITTGCADGRQCLPASPAGFPAICIYKTVTDGATVSCPSGYNAAPDFYSDFTDGRSCSACTCGPAVAQHCDMYAHVYAGGTCGVGGSIIYPGMCAGPFAPMNGAVSVIVSKGMPTDGSCNPSAPNPTGNANGTERTLVCCLP